ncbi:hypothetical protein NE237_010583 [Protea cynaroides]|uniref:Putative E3 ubiquitin-protein ligase LIN ARM-like domain-containing protein n=1 Tax=Protea cynaroides TaxID=273540 RepID=A0A9Q0KZT6_9MAGN|nr:hypothetical protein NE237_010583 [Protea cynaroides]
MHLNRQIEIDNGNTFIITTATKIYKVDFGNFGKFYSPINLDFPFRNPTCSNEIVLTGSCNGLLCLTHREDCVFVESSYRKVQAIAAHNLDGIIVLGFGYDHFSDIFKVVVISRIPGLKTGQDKVEAAVHSVGTNSWRSIGELEYYFRKSRSQVFEEFPFVPNGLELFLQQDPLQCNVYKEEALDAIIASMDCETCDKRVQEQ